MSYCATYYFGSYLVQHGSANFAAMVGSVAVQIQVGIWYGIRPMTEWGCGGDYTGFQVVMGTVAVPFIFCGAGLFHYFDSRVENMRGRDEGEDLLENET